MPLINITLPENALSDRNQKRLATQTSEALLKLEGMDQNPKAQMLSWVYLNKHAANDYFIGGQQTEKPHYRFDLTIFKNTLSAEHKQQLTKRLTEITLELEGTAINTLNAARIWVMFHEIEDGNWGGAGQIYSLQDLMQMMR